ncbi:type III PLP-dependent enzyme [Actinoallomurus rhizosphaericola]|uniref:type III PLP-dependent enzyme n=1 Tax=Actinoallomurus rhizosphaericola TaxID=2952536 RepID=UPI0020936A6E|nr:type III PLP-dependent enzyme [Actinoallomurus rhizosphaericola]MCO5999979.1 type III PLP-dependent enzyme [Actinoallomurus rhizosphaericola]
MRERALSAPLPAYVYDLAGLRAHAASVRAAIPVELYYAAKANPDPRLLAALAPYVDGVEVSSGGELAHVRETLPGVRTAFGGPGKTDDELAAAVGGRPPVHRLHVESPQELRRLAALRRETDVLLRINLPVAISGAALRMSGPFGMDPEALGACLDLLERAPWVRLRGLHAHLASGLAAEPLLEVAAQVLGWARTWMEGPKEVTLGGGMAVDYGAPDARFDWAAYGAGLASLRRDEETLRIEPGRALTAYCGWYVTDVLDVKRSHGEWYAVLRGGTHHLRTPVTKGHDQPFTVLPAGGEPSGGGPACGGPVASGPVTLVGQLCTPKDVFARQVPVDRLAVGDVVAFALAGAYAWNISHHDFLMHPKPAFAYIDL